MADDLRSSMNLLLSGEFLNSTGPKPSKLAEWFVYDGLKDYLPRSIYTKLKLAVPEDGERCIPKTLAEFLEEIMKEDGGTILEMYGGSEQLSKNLEQFWSVNKAFPKLNNPFMTPPTYYKSLNNQKTFISKQDVFHFLNDMMIRTAKMLGLNPPSFLIQIMLRKQQFVIENCFELVCTTILKELEEDYLREYVKILDEYEEKSMEEDPSSEESTVVRDSLAVKYASLLTASPQQDVEELLKTRKEWIEDIKTGFRRTAPLFKAMLTVFDRHPAVFQSFATVESQSSFPRTVRIFVDRKNKFVIKEELDKALGRETDMVCNDWLDTMSATEAMRMAQGREDKGQQIEFVLCPILRDAYTAAPIRAPDGSQCKLAADVFQDFFFELMHGFKVFQKAPPCFWDSLKDFAAWLPSLFNPFHPGPYFIKKSGYDAQHDRNQLVFTVFLNNQRPGLRPTPPRNDVGIVFKDIGHFCSDQMTPQVLAGAMSAWVEFKKEEDREITTRDRYEIAEKYVLDFFAKKFPFIVQFLHHQGACCLLMNPPCCENGKMKEEFSKPPIDDPVVEHQEEEQKPLTKPTEVKIPVEKTPSKAKKLGELLSQQNSLDSSNPPTPPKNSVEVPKPKKTKKKTARHNKEAQRKNFSYRLPITDQAPESKCCPKCLRSSNVCKKLREKLKEEKKKNEKLEVEIKELKKRPESEEKLMGELENVKAENEANLEMLKALQKQFDEVLSSNCSKTHESVQNQDQSQLVEDLLAKITLLEKELEKANKKFEMTPENYGIWMECRDQQEHFKETDPLGKAKQMRDMILLNSTNDKTKAMIEKEYKIYREEFLNLKDKLEQRIRVLQNNPKLVCTGFLPLPRMPHLSEEFEEAYEKVQHS